MAESQSGAGRRLSSSPFVVGPSSHHTHSLILLHGLGSDGQKFGKELLESGVCSTGKTLSELLPGGRFIFPTAKRRRSTALRRIKLKQWFDIASMDDVFHRRETQLEGLEESSREILDLISEESKLVPRANIILGGLSQGCAMALICLLAMDCPIGGFIGMSGWLPFSHDMINLMGVDASSTGGELCPSDDENPFAESDGPDQEHEDPAATVLSYVKDLISLDTTNEVAGGKSVLSTPVFLGHGRLDEKVQFLLGEQASRTLRALGFQVDWREYREQGHWYMIPDEIDDMVEFIGTRLGWNMEVNETG